MTASDVGKAGRLSLKLVVAVAIVAAALYAYFALASGPSAVPGIVTSVNSSTANVSVGFANAQLFGFANFTSANGTVVNSVLVANACSEGDAA